MTLRASGVILRSLRGRILLAALLWSLGLFVMLNHVVYKVMVALLPGLRQSQMILFGLTGSSLMLAALWLLASALRRVDAVRSGVASLRSGEGKRLDAGGLAELEPLVRDMNSLLDHRERVVRRALATAGDLAHGLKTPLAIVAQEAERLEATSESECGVTLREQVERMRRQVDYHLARARASASGTPYGAHVELRPVAERLVRTMDRLHAGKGHAFAIDIPESCTVRCETEDLEEMLGNILDNACKWARSAVTISASRIAADAVRTPSGVTITVEDDGPGIDPAIRDRVLQRGVRADEASPGSGLGLAIVADLADLYGGSVTLEAAPRGGLRVQLMLPPGAV
ncbi:MAG: GHKL domain-containing protein [Acidobacteria bacterium]|nr:GHKL domain-containing protein [Acidobacteriota bacterium]